MDRDMIDVAWEILFGRRTAGDVLEAANMEIRGNKSGLYGWLKDRQLQKTYEILGVVPDSTNPLTPVILLLKEANLRHLFDESTSETLLRLERAIK